MNWPEHGSPDEATHDQQDPHEQTSSEQPPAGIVEDDPAGADEEAAPPGAGEPAPDAEGVTPTDAQPRSQTDAEAGRRERPAPGAAVPSTWRGRDDDEQPPDVIVRFDEATVGDGAAARRSADAPGPTRQDPVSGEPGADEGRGFTRPDSSPHTGSWEAGPHVPDGVVGGPPQVGDEPRGLGHGETDAMQGADAPPSFTGSDASPTGGPVPFHGEPGPAPFHGEHGAPAEAETRDRPPQETGGRDPDPAPGDDGRERERVAPLEAPAAAVIEDTLAELEPDQHEATVICVANQKGGVGKTTTTVSLGAALAMAGAQVLVVDLDPQGNATTGLGLRAQEGAPSTYRVLVEQMDVEDATEPTAVRGLHVLPSSLDLAGAEIELVPAFSRENRLKQALDGVRDLYDVILIDCPPSLGLLTINALVAADQVLVPIQCEYYALEGLGQLMRTVKLVADSLNRGLGVGGVVLTMFDGRTNLSQQVVDEVRGYFGDLAYQTIVPRTVRLSEAPSYGQPIGVFDASSRGARAYERLAREVARRLDLELEAEEVSPLDRLLGPAPQPASPEEGAALPTDLDPGDVPGNGTPHEEPVAAGQTEPPPHEAAPTAAPERPTAQADAGEPAPAHEPWEGPHHERYRYEPEPAPEPPPADRYDHAPDEREHHGQQDHGAEQHHHEHHQWEHHEHHQPEHGGHPPDPHEHDGQDSQHRVEHHEHQAEHHDERHGHEQQHEQHDRPEHHDHHQHDQPW
jgi:chromosome partitioning protein